MYNRYSYLYTYIKTHRQVDKKAGRLVGRTTGQFMHKNTLTFFDGPVYLPSANMSTFVTVILLDKFRGGCE